MNTLLVGMKDFRDNISMYSKKIEDGKTKIIILKKNKPIMEILPIINKEDFIVEDFIE